MLRSAPLMLITFLLTVTSAFTQSDPETFKLTSKDINRFISSFSEIKDDLEKLEVIYDQSDNSLNMPQSIEVVNKVNNIVQKHGYTDYSDFIIQTGAIMNAYLAVEMGREAGSVQPEIQEAIKEIDKNPYYTAEQKKEMKEALIQSSKAMEDYSKSASTNENIAVVKPYVGQIRTMMDENDD